MNNTKMVTLNLLGHGIDAEMDVPVEMLFELIKLMPSLLDRLGIKKLTNDYSILHEKLKAKCTTSGKIKWDPNVPNDLMFMRTFQLVAVMGAHLFDTPLMLAGDGIGEYVKQFGGVDVTSQVESGEIPREIFHGGESIVQNNFGS